MSRTKAIAAEDDDNFESLVKTSLVGSDLVSDSIQLPVISTVIRKFGGIVTQGSGTRARWRLAMAVALSQLKHGRRVIANPFVCVSWFNA